MVKYPVFIKIEKYDEIIKELTEIKLEVEKLKKYYENLKKVENIRNKVIDKMVESLNTLTQITENLLKTFYVEEEKKIEEKVEKNEESVIKELKV